jgi:pimeloyl-ACP methyl ester carboxylesterase
LLYDYQNNLKQYSELQAYSRKHQPLTLVVWGKNDIFFTSEGGTAYKRDLKNVEVHLLDAGHFAIEGDLDLIAAHIRRFLTTYVLSEAKTR